MSKLVKKVGDYELGRTLGEGNFAKVKFAFNPVTKQSYAIKIVDKEKVLRHRMVDQIKNEISIMKLVRHPNVVHLHEVLASKTKIYMVMEFVSGGELYDKIVHQGKLSERESRRYFQQLIDAVRFCHFKGVSHRDLKPENLLLDEKQNLKISDFGLSALPHKTRGDGLLHTTCGTPNYVAPEVLKNKGYDGASADLWSCGVILYVLMAGFLPFDEPDLITLYKKIMVAEFYCPPWFSKGAVALLTKILNPNPKTRITFNDLVADPWFADGYSPVHMEEEDDDVDLEDVNAVFEEAGKEVVEKQESPAKGPKAMNAFQLIALSQGLQLSSMFEKRKDFTRSETRFDSKCPPEVILNKMEAAGKQLGFLVKTGPFKLRFDGSGSTRLKRLSVAVQVFEVAAGLYVVEVRKAVGDTLDYHKFYKELYSLVKDELVLEKKGTASAV